MTSIPQRSLKDEHLLCRICNYVLLDPRTLSCQHYFCVKCIKFCMNASDSASGFHCPVCNIFCDTSDAQGRQVWLNKLEKNLFLDQLISSVEIVEQQISYQVNSSCLKITKNEMGMIRLLKFWKAIRNLAEFQIQNEEKKLSTLRKEQKAAHIAIKQTCIDVWNLMKKDAFPNDWTQIASREQTLLAEVDAVCSVQSDLTEERISKEKEMTQTAAENIELLSKSTDVESVFESPQFLNDYSQMLDSGNRLLLCGTGPCVKVRFVPDSVPEKRLALGHVLVIVEDNLDQCKEVGAIQLHGTKDDKLEEEQDSMGGEKEISVGDSGVSLDETGSNALHADVEITQDSSHGSVHSVIITRSDGIRNEKQTHVPGQEDVCLTADDGKSSRRENIKEKHSVNYGNIEIHRILFAATGTSKPDEEVTKPDKEVIKPGEVLTKPVTATEPFEVTEPDEEVTTDELQQACYRNICKSLPMSYLDLMSDILSLTPITVCSSSTKMWSNLDESCPARVHVDLEDPNPGDLELFTVDNNRVVVLVDPHNKSIKSFVDSDTCHRIELNYPPARIIKIDESKCAVTFKSTSFICLLEVTPGLELTRCVRTHRPYHSISYMTASSQFVCCEIKQPKTLDILNTIGQLVRKIDLPTIDGTQCEPYYLKVMMSDNILICDVISRALICISQSGDVIFTYCPEAIMLPVGVCCDDQDNIFLADAKDNRVIQLSEEGSMLGHVVSRRDGLEEPWAVRLDVKSRQFCVIVKRSEFKWFHQTVSDFKHFQQEK